MPHARSAHVAPMLTSHISLPLASLLAMSGGRITCRYSSVEYEEERGRLRVQPLWGRGWPRPALSRRLAGMLGNQED